MIDLFWPAPGRAAAARPDLSAAVEPFKLRLELPTSGNPDNPVRHTFCLFRSTSPADLGRTISAAFYGAAQQQDVVAVWEHPDGADADAEPLVHTLGGVVAHPELYTGRVFSLTAPERKSAPVPALDFRSPEPEAVEPQPPPSLVEVLAPLTPHPRRNPRMLVALMLAAGGLLSRDTSWPEDSDAAASAPTTLWRLTASSRMVALLLFVVVLSSQLRSVLRDDGARRACVQLQLLRTI